MSKLKPVVLAIVGAGLMQACGAPVRAPLKVEPVQRVSQSIDQSAAGWYRLGKYHHERGQASLALGAYAQSLSLDGGQLDARNAVAALDAQQGRLEDARKALELLVADYPGEVQPHNNLGYVYYLQGDYPAAVAMLRRALAMDANARAYANLQMAERALRDGPPASALAAAPAASASASAAAAAAAATAGAGADAGAAAAAPAPGAAALSRMELVELHPNVLELKLRAAATAPLAVAMPAATKAAAAPATASATAPVASIASIAPGTPAAARVRLEVVNGNGVEGLARRYRQVLTQAGIAVDRIRNERPYRQQTTTIHYRPGAEAQAAKLQLALPGSAALQASDQMAAAELRLILGKDAPARLATAERQSPPLAALADE